MGTQIKYDDENIRKQILRHVGEIIFTKGTKGWNMDDLSARAGLAKNTLYRIIGSKEDIIKEAVIEHIKDVQSSLYGILHSEENYSSRLKKALNIFPDLLNAVYSESFSCVFRDFPSVEATIINRRKEISKSIVDFINEGILNKELKKNLNAEIVFETFQAIVLYYLKSDYKPHEKKSKISDAFGIIMNGIIS
ncbi:MAG TPA: TetR/AcrR family transcriptional regulator [Spirochaetota bacterium]|jgi:AcrR family transcriptional regulator|nr:TetR/AcrR family transcriptional regulator [Spirochaetota bacterium]HOH38560.1 TetR/AcrR family transcriptional regulator [Spirochaetota bacterium]HPM34562.1 TetR/AcrR family transcriptional regulator [Spirochaetota bacterium]HPY02003.1 TetR/AcrR family transcriptional regulator [Spirochaetota bacterium]HQA51802.1 TetR/AcrR family transcriptional regulator [Spirochaetota bacterium]